ncbi:MAG TPA: 16S rRNA (cytidine(1402)-2'-O)-methyltransferase [Solirubrobacteraceae bacterium]|nr:16S rRNA (cytidine(1402)-2'-O)-methyltransferase [Solirubrobacteraceae bacterium]
MTPAEVAGGRLIVCPTPIGNLEDVTLRVLRVLREADTIACEDTRHTGVLLERHGLTGRLVSLHEHNEDARARELVGQMREGSVVALVADAGTPLISDPGFALVRACLGEGVPVEALPGPSAVTTALVASGLPADHWAFVGFLPRKRAELERLLRQATSTLLAFESPRRLATTLAVLAELDPKRPAAVCRELSKLHEEVRRGTAGELAAHYAAQAARGEIVLAVGAAEADSASREDALLALRELVAAGARPRAAATALAGLTGRGANELYRALTEAAPSDGSDAGGQ